MASQLPGLPLAAGERWHLERPFRIAAEAGAVDVLQPDVQWVGGATPTIRIARIAAEHGAELSVHCAANDSYGQHLAFDRDDNTPLSDLFLSMLHRMGVEADAFGSSNGTLNGLESGL